ncbi:hypothetical protein MKW92_051665 [Papaver armeniacum]|nr:hypothetical protein MKW92_051665 [Papaver armeniacum]
MSTDELISKHIIQPSTPTPCHLKNYSLSLIDQYVPPIFVPIILFYPTAAVNGTGSKQHDDDLELLKLSLSETLVHFYPMAGRLKDNITVDCNDEGIEFLVVKIKGKMCDFLMEPDEQLSRLLPSEVVSRNFVRDAQVIVQVTRFECGAIAISLCISHKIADICSIATFIRSWTHTNTVVRGGMASATCNTNQKLHPTFESAALFPPSKQLVSLSGLPPTLPDLYPSGETKSDNKIVSKRFVFNSIIINSVRGKLLALMDDELCRPTRVEIVSALIWKSVMKTEKSGSLSVVNHAVNLRKRLERPLQDASFGNLVTSTEAVIAVSASARTTVQKTTGSSTSKTNKLQQLILHDSYEFICQLREAISKIKGDSSCILHRTRGDHKIEDAVKVLWMTSWCNLGFYEIDFGWGKPIWVTTDATLFPHKNNFVMNDTICGEGIEVWVNLVEDDMAKFQDNLAELLN